MMDPLENKLRNLEGGRILDVATAYGESINYLIRTFKTYNEAIGIDMAADRIAKANEKYGDKIFFSNMDAERLEFEEDHFDTVSIRYSLHHLADIDKVLNEMKRVLKNNGLFIIGEMYQDPATEKPNSQRHWHHWRAEVDRLLGESHNETLYKKNIIQAAEKLNLKDMEIIQQLPSDFKPNHDFIKGMVETCIEHIEKLEKMGGQDDLIKRGHEIISILKTSGYTPEGVLFILGRKLA